MMTVYSHFFGNFFSISSTELVDEQFSDIDGKTLHREGYEVNQGDIIPLTWPPLNNLPVAQESLDKIENLFIDTNESLI
jgi:hypothetical protein